MISHAEDSNATPMGWVWASAVERLCTDEWVEVVGEPLDDAHRLEELVRVVRVGSKHHGFLDQFEFDGIEASGAEDGPHTRRVGKGERAGASRGGTEVATEREGAREWQRSTRRGRDLARPMRRSAPDWRCQC